MAKAPIKAATGSWPPRGMEGHSLRKFLAPFAVLGAQAALVAEVTRSLVKLTKSLAWRLKFRRKMYLLVQKVTWSRGLKVDQVT